MPAELCELKLTTLKRWRNVQVKINLGVSPYDNVTVCLNGPDLALQLVELAEITTNVDVVIPAEIVPQLEWVTLDMLRPYRSFCLEHTYRDKVGESVWQFVLLPNIRRDSLKYLLFQCQDSQLLEDFYNLGNRDPNILRLLALHLKTPPELLRELVPHLITADSFTPGLLQDRPKGTFPLEMIHDLWERFGPIPSILGSPDFTDADVYIKRHLDGYDPVRWPSSVYERLGFNDSIPVETLLRVIAEEDFRARKIALDSCRHAKEVSSSCNHVLELLNTNP